MDRGKNLPPKNSKSKPLGFSGDFIALGPKQSRAEPVDAKKAASSTSGGSSKPQPAPLPSLGTSDKKREAPSSQLQGLSQNPAKKPKPGLTNAGSFTALGRPALKVADPPSPSSIGNRLEPWEDAAIEVEASDLLNAIGDAESNDDEERIEAILCGSVKQLKTFSLSQRNKVEPILALALVYLAKWRSHYFNTELIVEALLVLLRRDVTASVGPFKGRTTASAASLACNLLLAGLEDSTEWPESFLKVFVEDSVGERVWVDREECQGFVENILTAFNTKVPSRNILQQESATAGNVLGSSGAASSPSITSLGTLGLEDDASVDSDNSQGGLLRGSSHLDQQQVRVIPRFQHLKDMAEALVMEIVNQHLSRRQQPASDLTTRNFLKFLTSTAGLPAVRTQAAQRLEMWLSNQKLVRPATDLLLAICVNCSTETPTDTDVLNALLRLRLKSKPLIQTYLTCFKELVEQQPDQLPLIVRLLIFNELSPSRGPNNMAVLAVLVQPWPDRAATILADVYMELLLNRDDYLRALRALLREVVRALRHDLPLPTFCAALLNGCMQERRKIAIREFEFKDRLLNSLADLTTLCIFLAISPSVRESASSRGDLREMELFRQFHIQASAVQRESINWLRTSIPSVFEPNRVDYIHCLRKVLFMESGEHYYNKDGWPLESDRPIMIRLASEIPVMEDTLIQILLVGLSKDHPLTAPDALELADQLLRRCAAVQNLGFLMLEADNQDIFDLVLRLTAYHYPENIALPQGYTPPNLAISTLYWKAWLMLLMLIAHNPSSLGSEAWNSFPTLRALMEMCITNDFATSSGTTDQTELQVVAIEKQTILEFETHLAAASTKTIITENSSLLLSQLTSLDPRGPTRRPPPAVIEQLRTLNTALRLGHLLCRSRQPDFLLEILHRQGAAQSKPWLADLVESNEGAWNVLPVQCLCEFLLHEAVDDLPVNDIIDDSKQQLGKRKERRHKHQQLVQHLRLLLTDPNQLPEACREVLDYLMRRLSAQKALPRHQALMALSVVLVKDDDITMSDGACSDGTGDDSQFSWLVHQLPTIPHFEAVRPAVIAALRAAFLIETQPQAVAAYLRFLSTCALEEPIQDQADLSLDLAQIIVERSSLIAALLPSSSNKTLQAAKTLECLLQLFWHYLLKAREPNKGSYTWSENQDQVLIQWQSGEAASLHILVVHAMVILLTYGAPQLEQQSTCFGQLLEIWFPASGIQPQAYLVETTEEANLYPDWLKLRMIRSPVDALVDTALKDLEPAQLILFIQSFGIPVSSMSKLLQTLDRMVRENPFAFVEVDMDKVYIQQLLQIQWTRGARGGLHFADIMQLGDTEIRSTVDSKAFNLTLRPHLDISSFHSKISSVASTSVITVDHASAVLRQLFDIKTVIRISQLEKNKAYRVLSNTLTQEIRATTQPSTEAYAIAFDNLLASASVSRNEFELLLAALERQPAFSCGLLRLLTSAASSPGASLGRIMPIVMNICKKIAPVTPDGHSSLKNIALQFVKNRGFMRSESTPADINTLNLSSKRLERHLQQLAAQALETNDTRSLVKSIVTNLSQSGFKASFVGLLVDWMELLDPEIITAQPDLEMRLLFGKTPSPPSCRPYALAMLVHQASWATLRKCIHKLLATRDVDAFEAKVVLDFLTALIKVPKLWQGREKHVPKHQQPEELLNLNHQQLFRLAEYIMSEYVRQQTCGQEKDRALHILQERSQLLLSCCGGSTKMEVLLARDVADLAGSAVKSERQKAAQQLLLQLYVRAPHVITRLPKTSFAQFDDSKTLLTAVPCSIDSMALTLISSLTSPQPGKEGARKMADYESALRKMAATHPLLLLRQFACLAAALRGRSHLDVFVLRSRNYMNVFSCILGIAQQLSSNLFTPEHREALEDMLKSFWCLFGNQRTVKESIGPLLQKFLQFLLDFVATAPFAASHCLQQHVPLLHDLQVTHPEMTAIKDLLSALSRPRPTDNEEDRGQPSTVPTRPSIRIGPILARLRQSDNYEEVVTVLQDLENVCGRVVCAPLEGAIADLRPLMSSSNQTVRNMTYMLILRYLKDNPNASTDLLPDYLDCLDNRNAAVVTTALERLPDFLLLCQENGDVLLQKTFNLAVESGYNTLTNLSEAVMLLQHQTGT